VWGNLVKKFIAATAVSLGLALASPVALTPAADAAAQRGCSSSKVTKVEYRKIHRGDSKAKVKRVFDSTGRLIMQGFGTEYREWNTCSRWGWVTVDFERRNGVQRVTGKFAYWG
jgi:hypothetical protein